LARILAANRRILEVANLGNLGNSFCRPFARNARRRPFHL
jgi:hypothetical protein